ncbi:VanZ family protein [Peribacillus sp. SCS-26]|uniref:VanZ family protein n=1 Tax=Paraperibacillus marinus TaxID=3115295 RepID=UPI00390594D8
MKIKVLLVIAWSLILLTHTLTNDLGELLRNRSVYFSLDPNPNFRSFFYLTDIALIHQFFIIVKLGHFFGFAVLDFLLFNLTRSHRKSILLSLSMAILTEVLQLFFGRDGRLYDIVIDGMGILLVYWWLRKVQR